MKKNNEGFTIVELIVVMALLVIFIAVFSLNIGQITGYNAKECYKKISSAITANKIETLGKAKETGDIYLQIYKSATDGRIYARTVKNGKTATPEYTDVTKLTKRSRVKVTYEVSGAPDVVEATESNPLNICFNRASGAIVDKDTGAISGLQKIYVEAGSYKYTIELVPRTGKIVGK